jgi:hypothetical protein
MRLLGWEKNTNSRISGDRQHGLHGKYRGHHVIPGSIMDELEKVGFFLVCVVFSMSFAI